MERWRLDVGVVTRKYGGTERRRFDVGVMMWKYGGMEVRRSAGSMKV